ncbi:hypothetical protein ANO11243_051700 [Dothideomycetidae sp. 11243]|nr:hypothetical protein ANO11243_051700 [fungal sp. No.11243]
MNSARLLSHQLRSPVLRQLRTQRRFASSGGARLEGSADNAFNRERNAVKDHAAATSDFANAPEQTLFWNPTVNHHKSADE